MEYVLAVAEEKSFSNAAKRLYITQPSLSQGIITLENQLGVVLFDRTKVPLSLTYAGEKYVDFAMKILNIEQEMEAQMGDIRGEHSGRLIIGISLFRNSTILTHVFPIFHNLYPNVKLIVREDVNEAIVEMASNGQLDVSFINRFTPPNLICKKIITDNVLLAVGKDHPICKQRNFNDKKYPEIDLRVFKDDFFALTSHNSNLRSISNDIFRDYGFIPKIAVETRSLELTHQFAVKNSALAIILDSLIGLYPEEQRARYFQFNKGSYLNTLYVCYDKNKYISNIVYDFIRITVEVVERQNMMENL
jgi:DNA-binding transcriptional LysR family regulator